VAQWGRGQSLSKLSVVIIVFNEEKNLRRTLDAISWADEIVVVDSGSTDDSKLICSHYPNCRVIRQPFLGYGPQKRFAVESADYDWILSIDADEVPDREMQEAIKGLMLDGTGDRAGYYLSRRLAFMGREFRYGKESGNRILRLFDRRKANYTAAAVHEKVEATGPTGDVSGTLTHYSYSDLADYFRKFNEYTSLMATQMYDRGEQTSTMAIAMRPPWVFFQYYFLRLNCLNGFAGFVYSLLSAHYKTVKYLKLYEMRSNDKRA
jgi:glycosyltransferase involved in cell wall biosynthesis